MITLALTIASALFLGFIGLMILQAGLALLAEILNAIKGD